MTAAQRERYSRQMVFPAIGEAGQDKLLRSRVAIAGCGALGTAQASILARAGVGRLVLIDRDFVELSNLQRQWLFTEADAAQGLPKAIAAARHLREANSECSIQAEVADLTSENIEDLLADAEIILDGLDNWETRYLINDYALAKGKPWIYGGAVGSQGVVMPVVPGRTCCLACIYPEPPTGPQPSCDTAGVLGSLTATVGALQAALALRLLVTGDTPRLLTSLDLWNGEIRQIAQPEPDPQCRACHERRFIWLEGLKRRPISLCGRNAVQIHERTGRIDLRELGQRLAPLGVVRQNEFALRFSVPPYELTIFADGRAIIKGSTDPAVARSLYARYVGL